LVILAAAVCRIDCATDIEAWSLAFNASVSLLLPSANSFCVAFSSTSRLASLSLLDVLSSPFVLFLHQRVVQSLLPTLLLAFDVSFLLLYLHCILHVRPGLLDFKEN
jgi:hypothetical protein